MRRREPGRALRLAPWGIVVLVLALPQAAADPSTCVDLDGTLAYWRAKVEGLPSGAQELRAFNTTLFPRLQLGTVTEHRASCDLLHALANAHGPTRALDLAIQDVHDAAVAGAKLRAERVVVEPAAMEAGRVVGARLRAQIEATSSTETRIARLTVLESLYDASSLHADAIGARLWREAEQRAWDSALRRVDAHVAEAKAIESRLSSSWGAVFAFGAFVDVKDRLDVDELILRSHGAPAHVERIQQARGALDAAVFGGTEVALGGLYRVLLLTVLLVAVAIGIVHAARPFVARMEQDALDVDVALRGVPPR